MTKDEYKNLLIKTSLEGGFPSIAPKAQEDCDPPCCYRSPEGKKCAAGLLIPDDKYKPEMEGKSVHALQQLTTFEAGVNDLHFDFLSVVEDITEMELSRIQAIHDNLATRSVWNHDNFVARLTEYLG